MMIQLNSLKNENGGYSCKTFISFLNGKLAQHWHFTIFLFIDKFEPLIQMKTVDLK